MMLNGLRVSGRREAEKPTAESIWGQMLFFPGVFLWLELVLRLAAGHGLKYLPVSAAFALSAGLVCSAGLELIPGKYRWWTASGLAGLLGLIYGGELVCKTVMQSFYPLFSMADTAVDNDLMDYWGATWRGIVKCLPILILMLLPVLLAIVFRLRLFSDGERAARRAAGLLCSAAVAHLLGVGTLYLPWQGDLTPKLLYHSDVNIEDQVEQLGLWTMLRLDVQHAVVPARNDLGEDFSGLDGPELQHPEGEGTQPQLEEPDGFLNVMEVDLEALAASAESEDTAWLARYFASVTPTAKNEYTGRFQGYNVIQLSIEGFSGYAIDPELTPTLYRLTHEGFVFPNFYTPLHYTSTSGGECQNLLGLYPKAGNPITMKETGVRHTDCRFSLARQLGALGYTVLGYHGNEDMYGRYDSHSNLGYTWKQYQTGLELEMTADGSTYAWPQSDVYVAETSMEDYLSLDEPFHVYYMTISGHMPYNFNRVAAKYRELVEPLPYSETTKAYLATAIEADRMLQTLLDGLERAGELDHTLIVACADHIPYFNVDTLEELSGQRFGSSEDMEQLDERSINFDVYRSALILWAAGMEEPVVVDKPCGQVDILPTVSNLLGLQYDSRMLAGSDLLSDAPGLVIFSSRSWLTDRGFYDRYTQTFTPADGESMTLEEQEAYIDDMKRTVQYKLGCTEKIVNTDFYRLAFGE